ncbi:hypothetical protein HU200_020176 [Digitaria exilis]|uniref:GRAS family transcription factor n=1 Tax=Digitaria exilis TaxID=1010633 RepID=A0A835F1M2_9POAL|nr:hypothetical protein HU200_020176 [Digitaria exilis]
MAKQASTDSAKGQIKGSSQQKLRGKRQNSKEVVDLRSLLIHCAQAVAADDRVLATDLIKKIRQHSSSDGDCTQRLAFYLVDGLEARLSGMGIQMHHKLLAKRVSDEEVFKIYSLCLAASPLLRASYCFANRTIIEASRGQSKVHIVDFGICFGFQWPSLIQQFAEQGVPPKLRITGIDVARPGFSNLEITEQAGKRLADYANMFKVPFQYQGITSRYENIQIEDIGIEEDEVLIVNSLYRMKTLGDETVAMNSARDRVLKIMRRMNPKVFILGIVNGSYSSPFFITRFKELLFHYSSLFDMFDANVPRDNETRKLIEGKLLGREAMNIIAYSTQDMLVANFRRVRFSKASSPMDSREYCDIDSNITLEYINRVLMEEDIDEKDIIYQEHDALQATEKPFYDILGQAYPSSAKEMVLNNDSTVDCPYGSSNNNLEGACCGSFVNGFLGPQVMHLTANHCASETDHLSSQFTKRAEEANRSVPIIEKLVVDLDSSELADSKQMTQATVGRKGKHVTQMMSHLHVNLELLDARNSNHLAIAGSEIIRNGSFDNVLLCTEQLYRDAAHLREMKAKEACDSSQNAQSKGYGQGQVKTRAKKQQEEAIDFRSLLIQCAEAIASNNQPFDRELLTKIRNHSSPNGDSSQRLAIYFVDALEARLAGTGSQMYHKLIAKRRSTTDMLKANRLCTAACPFTKYQVVVSRWENTCIEDLNIDKHEVLIINCLHQMKNLGDETEDIDSARDRVGYCVS